MACFTKGKKEGSARRVAKFMVAVSHSKCYPYKRRIDVEKVGKFIEEQFSHIFCKGKNKEVSCFSKLVIHTKISKVSREAVEVVGCCLFKIPAHSPDLNLIENIFHLREDTVSRNLTKESFRQSSKRITQTVLAFPVDVNDTFIE